VKITVTEVEQVAATLAQAAALFNPAIGGTIIRVVEAATAAVNLSQKILAQAQDDPAVWREVTANYQRSLDAFNASVAANPGK
jgi:hypothetical protein